MSAATRNPFPGLRPFLEGEEHLFFGRESKVDAMVDKLAATRFLAVVGTSGSGKSSLVNCGLRPALHRGLMAGAGESWRVAQFRPGYDPIGSLAAALAAEGVLFSDYAGEMPLAEVVETCLTQSASGLADLVRMADLPEGVNVLVVADQFEELFRFRKLGSNGPEGTYSTSEEAIAFVNLLLAAHSQPGCPIHVVITMRSDFLGDCSQFHGLPEAINLGQYLVPRLTRDERRASIAGPVAVGGAELDPALLTRLVNDVGDNPDQLSILQHALRRTWTCWQKHGAQGSLTLEHYDEIGSMSRALDEHAEEAFAALGTPRRERICETVFKALTDLGTDPRGIRRPLKLGTLCELAGAQGQEDEVRAVIDVFRDPSRAFLMPPAHEPLSAEKVIDISHESLMRVWQRLRRWAEDEAQSARRFRRLAETATLEAEGKAGLWSDPDLQLALDWRKEAAPTAAWATLYGGGFEKASAFLEKSRHERDERLANAELNRRWHARWRVGIAVFGLAIVATSYFIHHETLAATLAEKRQHIGDAETNKDIGGNVAAILKAAVDLAPLLFYFGPPLVLCFLLDFVGKRFYRRLAYAGILREVIASSDKAAREERLARAAITDAAEALHTSYAGFWRRAGAWLLDFGIFAAGTSAIMAALMALPLQDAGFDSPLGALSFLIPFVCDWLYQARMLCAPQQATVGMRAMGLFATGQKAERLSFGTASAWYFAKLISYLPLGTGFFAPLWTRRRQTFHDLTTRVVILARPNHKISPWAWVACIVTGGFLVIGLLPLLPLLIFFLIFVMAVLFS